MLRWVDVRGWLATAALLGVISSCQPNAVEVKTATPGSPAARSDASSAYDPAHGTIVMFGGATRAGVLDETWTWDGSAWHQQHPATSPPAREFAFMGYDPATSRVVMFGGTSCTPPSVDVPTGCEYQPVNAQAQLDDTWSWDGRDWTRVNTQHEPHMSFFRGELGGLAADLSHNKLVLVAWPAGGPQSPVETWTLRDGDWQELHPPHPPASYELAGPAYDEVSGHLILQQLGERLAVTSWWDGSDWRVYDQSVRTPRSYGRLVSVGKRGLLLIWSDQTYAWNGHAWTSDRPQQLPTFVSAQPLSRVGWTAAFDERTNELVLYGGRVGPGGPDLLGDTVGWDGTSWRTLATAATPPLPAVLNACSPKQSLSGLGGGPFSDPNGVMFEVEFGEPPSGPCHLHVAVTATVMRGNDIVTMPNNPATQPLDMDLKPGSGHIGALFDVHGACTLGPGVIAKFEAGDLSGEWDLTGSSGCSYGTPMAPSVTTSVRRFAV